MRAAVTYGSLATLGSLVLSALVAVPAQSADADTRTRKSADATPAFGTPATTGTGTETHGVLRAAARAAAAGISFGPCPAAERLPAPVTCGTVEVPLDYADPDGRTIKLTVSRAEASGKPSDRQGALVYNPGGPGASSTFFPLVAELPTWKRMAGAYDFVGYAPRGVGASAPLSCQDPKEFVKAPTQAPVHPSEAYKRQRISEAKAYAEGCARRAGAALRHYTSLNNARDLDVLRAALGERQLTFMGASYGTYFGALYATLFPGHVRRMVFDSAVNPDPRQIWYRNNLDQSEAFEQRWADFRSWVAKHDKAYRLGADARQVQRNYDEARARLAARPAGGTVGPGQLHLAMLTAGYSDAAWPSRAEALSEFLKGKPKLLISLAAPRPDAAREQENANAVYTAVECNDAPWPTDWQVWDRDNSELAQVAPFETWDNVWMNLPCAYWPAPRQQPVDIGTWPGQLPPTLILAAERDAATPYAGALELRDRLAGSVLVTEENAGTHGVAGGDNDCVNEYVDDYLLNGETPQQDAVCAARPQPVPAAAGTASSRELRPVV